MATDGRQGQLQAESRVELEIRSLKGNRSPRSKAVDPDHARLLAESFDFLPPIVVHRETMTIIDGVHRVAAARIVGRRSLPAEMLDCDIPSAYVEAVRRNVEHGKPLTLGERRTAAQQVLRVHGEWSDRRVAVVCGLSDKTIATLRPTIAGLPPIMRRVGRDGRIRTVDVQSRHDSGISEGTRQAESSRFAGAPTVQRPQPVPQVELGSQDDAQSTFDWQTDNACAATVSGSEFATWFSAHRMSHTEACQLVAGVPISRIYLAVAEAEQRAAIWTEFAHLLEQRARRNRA